MSGLLDELYRLQERLRFVQTRQRQRDTVPAELTEVDGAFREKLEAVARLKQRLIEAELENRKASAELADLQEKQKKYQAQLRNVQSSREYSAVLNEMDGVEKLIRSTEDRVLTLEEELETSRADLKKREEALPKETEEHEEKMKDWRAVQRGIDEELDGARREIADLEARIRPRERSEFQRLLEKKGGLAVARVISASCSACHVKVRPAAMQALKAGNEIIYCDSCRRILYYDHANP
jgi:predicted  nucleic acid-binding Zn-ribbon protein